MTAGFELRYVEQLRAAVRVSVAGGTPRLPEGAAPLWDAFRELASARSWHAHGPNPIPFAEIEAWARLMRWPLEPRHVAILRAMDLAWMEAVMVPRDSRRPSATLTPELFDVMTM